MVLSDWQAVGRGPIEIVDSLFQAGAELKAPTQTIRDAVHPPLRIAERKKRRVQRLETLGGVSAQGWAFLQAARDSLRLPGGDHQGTPKTPRLDVNLHRTMKPKQFRTSVSAVGVPRTALSGVQKSDTFCQTEAEKVRSGQAIASRLFPRLPNINTLDDVVSSKTLLAGPDVQ